MDNTIDKLNFNVIINDEDFNKQIKKMEEEAKRFNTSMSNLLDLKKQAQQWSQKDVENNRRAWQAKVDEGRAQERINREKVKTEGLQRKINAQIDQATNGYKTQSRILKEIKSAVIGYLSVQSAGKLLASLVRVTGEFELQKTTLAAMLGDLNQAEQVISKIQGLAVESPFQFKELTTYAKQLSAFSVPAQELYDTTKMLADISAGLGVGMDRIVLAYGQVRSAAFLRGQEIRQFTEAGIPILDELAKQFTKLEGRVVSTGEVFDKVSKRLVPFEMVAQIFKEMTSEGGKFFNMQAVQAETLKGKISNLKDAYEVMLNEIGKGQSENLKGAVDWARKLMQNYEETGRVLVELVAAYGVYKTALFTLTVATNNFALANSKLYTSLVNATKWAINNPYVILAAGITAAGYAIYKNMTALEGYEKVHKSFLDTEKKYSAALASEEVKLDTLYASLKLAKEGTEEYEKAKKQIYTQYAGYISDLKAEGVEVDNLVTLYGSLKIKVQEYTQAKFRSLAQTDLDQTFEQEVSSVRDRYKTLVSEIESIRKNAGDDPLSADDKVGLWQYITGDIATLWDMAEKPELKRIKQVLTSKILPFGDIADELKGDLKKIKDTYASDMQAIINLYGETSEELAENDPFKIPLGGDEGGKSDAQKAIENQIKSIQKLQDAYEKLKPYLSEELMNKTLKNLFPNIEEGVIDSLDFEGALRNLADQLEEFDEEAAQNLRDSISKDVAGAIAESFKAVEQYKKTLESWLGEDLDLTGEGVSFDISKIIRNLNNEYAKIDQKRARALELLAKAEAGDAEALKLVRQQYGEEVWQLYLTEGKKTIEELARLEREMAHKNAEEKIRDTANKYIQEKLQENNIDLSDFGDKNISQVRGILKKLGDLVAETKEEMATLELGGLTDEEQLKMEGLIAVLDILQIKIADTGEELDKKIGDKIAHLAEEISSTFASIGDEVSSLGDSIGNEVLAKFGKQLSEFGDFAKDLSSGIKDLAEEVKDVDFENTTFKDLSEGAKGGIIGLIGTVAGFVYGKIADIITGAYEAQRRLGEAAKEYSDIMLEIRRESHSGIFGTDELALAAENTKILAEAQDKYTNSLKEFNEVRLQGYKPQGGFGREGLKKQSVADMLEYYANKDGWELYRENGELNIGAIEAYYDTFAKSLPRKQRDLVNDLIENGKAYDDAAAQQAQYLTNLFGGVADTIAENMVDAFIESGDAAIDMSNVISDVSKQMVADLIKTLYLMPILNEYKEKFEAVDASHPVGTTENAEAKIALLDTALQEIAGQSDKITETLEHFSEYLGEGEGQGTSDLGEGIKGITEDQANLLASYLNAIRADVAYSKVLWQRMDANTQAIANALSGFSAPSFMEYQAKIEANTYNNMVATQAILERLNSMLTTGNDGTALRVWKDN